MQNHSLIVVENQQCLPLPPPPRLAAPRSGFCRKIWTRLVTRRTSFECRRGVSEEGLPKLQSGDKTAFSR
jgi:hypothetical protein